MKLVLFDVDHTLVDAKEHHKKAFVEAFRKTYDINLDYSDWDFHGYTDLQIIEELLSVNELKADADKISMIIDFMIKEFSKADLTKTILLEGVENLLRALDKKEDIILGLVTGNIEEIAYTKLKHLNIDQYFILGGFGNSSVIRSELIEEARKKAEERYGKIHKVDTIIVGDTLNDIKAAKEAGVKVIAVATGSFDEDTLKKSDPDHTFKDLKDTNKILEVINNG